MFDNIDMVRIFGSRTRGDHDEYSDLDIIVVYEELNILRREEIKNFLEEKFLSEVSISWYSKKKLNKYFKEGHLFAWHLYLESNQIEGLPDNYLKPSLKPNEYKNCKTDILSLIKIIDSTNKALKKKPYNLIYEAGLLYVCCRNIGMAASSILSNKLEFGRYSPYKLIKSKNQFPMKKEDYNILIDCRLASMRGAPPKELEYENVFQMVESSKNWAEKIFQELK